MGVSAHLFSVVILGAAIGKTLVEQIGPLHQKVDKGHRGSEYQDADECGFGDPVIIADKGCYQIPGNNIICAQDLLKATPSYQFR